MSTVRSREEFSPDIGTVGMDERSSENVLTFGAADFLKPDDVYPQPGTPSIVDADCSRVRPELMAEGLANWNGDFADGRPPLYPLGGSPSGPEFRTPNNCGEDYNGPAIYLLHQRYASSNGSYGGDRSYTEQNSSGSDRFQPHTPPHLYSPAGPAPSSPAAFSDSRYPDPAGSPDMRATLGNLHAHGNNSAPSRVDIQQNPTSELETTMYNPEHSGTALQNNPDALRGFVFPVAHATPGEIEGVYLTDPYATDDILARSIDPALEQQTHSPQQGNRAHRTDHLSPPTHPSAPVYAVEQPSQQQSPHRLHPSSAYLRRTPSSYSAGPSSPALSAPHHISLSPEPVPEAGRKSPISARRTTYAGRGTKRKKMSSAASTWEGDASSNVVYSCAFAPYRCDKTFKAKNEWKRHAWTIHVQPYVYYCDVDACGRVSNAPDTHGAETGYSFPKGKRYNRKDLFTEHFKRIHAGWQKSPYKPSKSESDEFDAKIAPIHKRCCFKQRDPPEKSVCPYCGQEFGPPLHWDARMEHVAAHIEQGDSVQFEDRPLSDWGLRNGVLELKGDRLVLVKEAGGQKSKT